MGKYVVAVKRNVNYTHQPIPKEQRTWSYGQYDAKHHRPVFYDLRGALYFDTPKMAEMWFWDNVDLFVQTKFYDLDTFEIQEVDPKTIKKINYAKPPKEISWLWG